MQRIWWRCVLEPFGSTEIASRWNDWITNAKTIMGRRAKTLLPISDNLRKPTTVQPETVSSRLMEYRQKQKYYYDQGAKEQDQCQPGHVVTPWIFTVQKAGNLQSLSRMRIVKADNGRNKRICFSKPRRNPMYFMWFQPVSVPYHSWWIRRTFRCMRVQILWNT